MLFVFVNCNSSNLNSKRDTVEVVNGAYHSSKLVDDIPDTINSVIIVKNSLVNSSWPKHFLLAAHQILTL
ncbi:hypothetical protein DYU05_13370 [Mucilaginibacter terrenus]|uniref:Uncharacterized protein n=1 Tax=Mucilaginibacter terrenus TaxID=2482727 RepID=A0A3E2NQ68_9SPHI|nr:hypothetical protein [Mucilaginibacter terrenus]RFZ83132.1 hypothetical protein DYU05_13370 [Mucilaginibacter terrenus]